MVGRKPKITTSKNDRKYQRDRTKKMIYSTKDMDGIPNEAPKYFKGIAKETWERLAPILNKSEVVKISDTTTLEMLCVNYEMAKKAYNNLQKYGQVNRIYRTLVNPVTGDVVGKDFCGYKRNPSTQILDAATNKIKSLAAELGLTPASRAQLLKLSDDDSDDGQSMDDILAGSGDEF